MRTLIARLIFIGALLAPAPAFAIGGLYVQFGVGYGKYGGNDWVDLLPQMKIEAPAKEGRDNLKVTLWRHSGANVNLIAHQNPCDGPPPCIPGEAERTTDQAPMW